MSDKTQGHLIVTRGLPGSGKDTLAREWSKHMRQGSVIISRDGFRDMLVPGHSGVLEQEFEDLVTKLEKAAVADSLDKGLAVFVCDSNLPQRRVREWLGLAVAHSATWEVCDLTSKDLEIVLKQNAGRENPVPREVILKMHARYIASGNAVPSHWEPLGSAEPTKGEPYVPDTSKPLAIIVDIDGSVAKMNGRSPYDYTKVSEDLPNWPVIDYATAISMDLEAHLVFVSGRPEACRGDTQAWLERYFDWGFELFMRSDQEHADGVKDYDVKLGIFDREIRHQYNVHSCIDDRTQVVRMWRSLNLTCLQVAPGDF